MKEIEKIVSRFAKGIIGRRKPDQMCFAVCAPLQVFLDLCGFRTELIEGEIYLDDETVWQHYWLKMEDGTIIDPTADQFQKPNGEDMPRTYIGPLPDWYFIKEKETA